MTGLEPGTAGLGAGIAGLGPGPAGLDAGSFIVETSMPAWGPGGRADPWMVPRFAPA
jgi:hypothetical protein